MPEINATSGARNVTVSRNPIPPMPPPNPPPTPEEIAKELLAPAHTARRLDGLLGSKDAATRERFLRALGLLAESYPRDSAATNAKIRDIFMAVLKNPRAAGEDLVMAIVGMDRVQQASGKPDQAFREHVLAMFQRPLRAQVGGLGSFMGLPQLPELLAQSIASWPDGTRRLQALLTGVVDAKVRLPDEHLEAAITTLALSDARSVDLLKRFLCAPGSQPRIRDLVSARVLKAALPPEIPGGNGLRAAALAWALERRAIAAYGVDPLSKLLQNHQDPEDLRLLARDMSESTKDSAVPPGFKRVLDKWASLLSDSAALGITQVARYDPALLAHIIRERKAENIPDPNRNLAVYFVASDDHNGALGMEGHWIKKIADGGPLRKNRVLVVEVRSEEEVSKYLARLASSGQKVDTLVISGHGSESKIALSKDRTFPGYYNTLEANPAWLNPVYLAQGAAVVFKSCSGGVGGADNPRNLGNRARQALNDQGGAPADTRIFSAEGVTGVRDIVLDENGKIRKVVYTVPTLQSRRPGAEDPAA